MITGYNTIKQLADSVRQDGLANYGEAGFARLCLAFERRIDSDFDQALAVLAAGQDPKAVTLALVWLDGQGYSLLTVAQLAAVLYKLRERHSPHSRGPLP
jgi:hypothetical protein